MFYRIKNSLDVPIFRVRGTGSGQFALAADPHQNGVTPITDED
jgi:hypothetical protein